MSDRAEHPDLIRLERENAKLRKVNKVLIDRVERSMDHQGNAFSLFQTAIVLEGKVRERTLALLNALTNLETAKESAETARRFLLEAIESISEGFLLCDADDQVILTNKKYHTMFPSDGAPFLSPCKFEAMLRVVVASGIIADAETDPDGWVTRRLESHANPGEPFILRTREGGWLQISERRTRDGGCVSLYTDITEIKVSEERRRERELAEKSALLQSTLDNLAQGVSVFDARGCLVAWNPRFAELLAIPPDLLRLGTMADRLVPPEIMGPAGTDGVLLAEHATSLGRLLELRRNQMPDGGVVITYTDITEQRLAAEQLREAKEGLERRVEERTSELREANLSKTRFLAAASHDLLQPLSAARVFTSVLTERRLSPANQSLVRNALVSMDSVDEILTALLEISKLDANVQPVNVSDFDLSNLFAHLAAEFEMMATRNNLRLRIVPSSVPVRSDPQLLGRILRNYIGNAMRYTEAGGRILLGCRRCGDKLLIGVWDTGIGVPADKLEEIFQEFRRLSNSAQRSERGMGLGLAIVQRIARTLDHPLVVRSQPGRGSLFGIELPRASRLPPATPPAIVAGHGVARLDGVLVAMIDNDAAVLASMHLLLEGWGGEILPVTSGRQALDAIAGRGRSPDLIIADYYLDDGEVGLDVISAIRSRHGAAIPGVVITADYSAELQRRVEQAGCHLLNKPLRRAKLRSLLAFLLQKEPG
ncbi:MAG TPA: NahK/ErcS family hybrid sensor histidine kinase/response regulator [Telmatospirillum sp.]|nr:NahK/ErcS family hybrid sensor histidine kinase/response regulator [Telmatospirillum sp.]